MKIRKLNKNEKIKTNEYVIEDTRKNLYGITLNIEKIYQFTIYMDMLGMRENIKNNIIDITMSEYMEFLDKNTELISNIVNDEIQYVLDCFAMVFCTKNNFNTVKRNFYNIGYKMEDLIIFLISKNISQHLVDKFIEQIYIERSEKDDLL